jgi:hypothetical protein
MKNEGSPSKYIAAVPPFPRGYYIVRSNWSPGPAKRPLQAIRGHVKIAELNAPTKKRAKPELVAALKALKDRETAARTS